MDRRAFVGAVAGGLLVAPVAAQAQQARRFPRAGYVSADPPALDNISFAAFRQG